MPFSVVVVGFVAVFVVVVVGVIVAVVIVFFLFVYCTSALSVGFFAVTNVTFSALLVGFRIPLCRVSIPLCRLCNMFFISIKSCYLSKRICVPINYKL